MLFSYSKLYFPVDKVILFLFYNAFCHFSDPLSMTCSDLEVTASEDTGATVQYQVAASGGMPPYGIACNPPNGTRFSISTMIRYTVTCTVTDDASTEVPCTFFVQMNGKCLSGSNKSVLFTM